MQKARAVVIAATVSLLNVSCSQAEQVNAEPEPTLAMIDEVLFQPVEQSAWEGATTIEIGGTRQTFAEAVSLQPIASSSISPLIAGQRLAAVDYNCFDCAFVEEFGEDGAWAGFKRGLAPMRASGEWRILADRICVLLRSPDDTKALSVCRQLLCDEDGRLYLPDFRFYAFRDWDDLRSVRSYADRVLLFRVALDR